MEHSPPGRQGLESALKPLKSTNQEPTCIASRLSRLFDGRLFTVFIFSIGNSHQSTPSHFSCAFCDTYLLQTQKIINFEQTETSS